MTIERTKPKSVWRKIERWMVGLVMAMIAFVLEKMVLRSVRKAGKGGKGGKGGKSESREELHTTLTSKGGEVDLSDVR
ncbi:MAG TPA: hypothetical protein VGQ01_02220 [Actinomycetota bacterium]|nr:hypothetical protein [Actinomycetota bacterium]